MIEFATWLPQIKRYCAIILNEGKIRRAWINKDFRETSVTDFDELYEQIFDDLDAEFFLERLPAFLPNKHNECLLISEFLDSLREVNRLRGENPLLLNPKTLLDSSEWEEVRIAAKNALIV